MKKLIEIPNEFLDICEIFDSTPENVIHTFISLITFDNKLMLLANEHENAINNAFYHNSEIFNEIEEDEIFNELRVLSRLKNKNSKYDEKYLEWKTKWLKVKSKKRIINK